MKAVCGVVGSGKTVTLRRFLQQRLREENKINVARSLSIEKHSIKLATLLISALFYDLAQDKQALSPRQGKRREKLVRKGKRPVALFVDEAHDLNGHTLTGRKRVTTVVEDGGGRLSVILAGHPKLRNDLRRLTMEEVGCRTDIFTPGSIAGSQREYIQWLLKTSLGQGKPEDVLTADAIDLLAMKLRTPLQVQLHLTLALESGYQTGEKPITAALAESVISRQLDNLELSLTRHGYRLKDMVEQFDAKPAEIRVMFNRQLDPARTAEIRDNMLAVRLPI